MRIAHISFLHGWWSCFDRFHLNTLPILVHAHDPFIEEMLEEQ